MQCQDHAKKSLVFVDAIEAIHT